MIPKIIHTIWLQGYEFLPEKKKDLLHKLKKLHPDLEFIVWDYKMIYPLMVKNPKLIGLFKDVDKLSGFIHSKVIQKTIASYLILKEFGGIYYDGQFDCLSLIKNIFIYDLSNVKENSIYITSSSSYKINIFNYLSNFFRKKYYFSSDFIAIQPSHPIWEKVFENIESKNSKKEIHDALNNVLNENSYPITLVECNDKLSKYIFTKININNNTKKLFFWEKIWLFLFVFLIIFIVDKVNQYNIIKFSISNYIPGFTHPPSYSSLNVDTKDKKKKNK
jgi:mannosyltransferase OCH1-like enzyme